MPRPLSSRSASLRSAIDAFLQERLETDPDFAAQRALSDWPDDLCRRFANWLNDELRGRLQFDDGSYGHWYKQMLDELRARQREGLIDA